MHLMTEDLKLLTLVPNHLSTVKKQQIMTSISHPKSTTNTKNTTPTTLHNKKPHQKWRGSEKESGGEREKGEKKGGNEDAEEKKRCREG